MTIGPRRTTLAARVVVAAVVLSSAAAWADDRVSVSPSVSVGEVYDGNVFLTPSSRQADLVTRISPGIQTGYRSPLLQLVGRYTFEAETYRDHRELDAALARQLAGALFKFTPTRRLGFGTDVSYFRTGTPQELNILTNLAVGRARAEQYSFAPSMTYQFGPLSQGALEYGFLRDILGGGGTVETQTARLTFDRQLTPADRVQTAYQLRRFAFEDGLNQVSHVVTFGWNRRISRLADLSLRLGPRISDGRLRPEFAASIRESVKQSDISFSYERSDAAAIGQTRSVDVERLALRLTVRPVRRLEFHLAPGMIRNTEGAGGLVATVHALDVEFVSAVTRSLKFVGSYHKSIQNGALRLDDLTIAQSVIVLKMVVSAPQRDRF